MQKIKENKATMENKVSDNIEEKKEGESKKDEKPKEGLVPIEYFAIDLMHLITSQTQQITENHREVF
jgi:hypothetical protein